MLRDIARRGFRGYGDFAGRAGRREYFGWLFFVATALDVVGLASIGAWFLVLIAAGDPTSLHADIAVWAIQGLMLGATLLLFGLAPPTLAVAARRLRDGGRSRWWLVPMVLDPALAWALMVDDRLPGDAPSFALLAALSWVVPGLLSPESGPNRVGPSAGPSPDPER